MHPQTSANSHIPTHLGHLAHLQLQSQIQKITAHLPKKLLADAMLVSKAGITETIKAGLIELTRAESYNNFRKFKGKVKFSINLKELREDRR